MKSTTGSHETLHISGAMQQLGRWIFLCIKSLWISVDETGNVWKPLIAFISCLSFRMPSDTISASISASSVWKTSKELCGRWMRLSSTEEDPRRLLVMGTCPWLNHPVDGQITAGVHQMVLLVWSQLWSMTLTSVRCRFYIEDLFFCFRSLLKNSQSRQSLAGSAPQVRDLLCFWVGCNKSRCIYHCNNIQNCSAVQALCTTHCSRLEVLSVLLQWMSHFSEWWSRRQLSLQPSLDGQHPISFPASHSSGADEWSPC